MNHAEARSLLGAHLDGYRRKSYADLVAILDQPQSIEVRGASGTTYQIEVEVFWDGLPSGNIRVRGAIDDRGLRALVPHTDDFIVTPNRE